MRAAVLTSVLALLCLCLPRTVDAQSVRPPKPTAPVKPPAGTTFTGCLAKSSATPKEYELTVTSVAAGATTPTSKVYRLMPIAAGLNLAEHVGHRVTITGSQTGATDAKQTRPQVRVTDIHHVAPDCK
jgi:hypothetical protein